MIGGMIRGAALTKGGVLPVFSTLEPGGHDDGGEEEERELSVEACHALVAPYVAGTRQRRCKATWLGHHPLEDSGRRHLNQIWRTITGVNVPAGPSGLGQQTEELGLPLRAIAKNWPVWDNAH